MSKLQRQAEAPRVAQGEGAAPAEMGVDERETMALEAAVEGRAPRQEAEPGLGDVD